ncbi:MAG: hypothetical protein ABGZ17_08385 [Planctomycetaceae bacterium]
MNHACVDTAVVVVFELRPAWTPELQRQLRTRPVRVRACRTVGDIDDCLGESQAAVVVLDLDGDAESCLRYLGGRAERWRGVPVIAVGSERMRELEWAVRELGATSFACGRVTGAELAGSCCRLWV